MKTCKNKLKFKNHWPIEQIQLKIQTKNAKNSVHLYKIKPKNLKKWIKKLGVFSKI